MGAAVNLGDQREFKRDCQGESVCALGLFIRFFLLLLCLLWGCGKDRQVGVGERPDGRKTAQSPLIFTFVEKK